jgi:cysteine desulfurase / selenocysteine lyase
MIDVHDIKPDFPILSRMINGQTLVYLDNAATTQKPKQVMAAEAAYYQSHNANIHRGIYTLAEEATAMYEASREKVRSFMHAKSVEEIIFVRNATEALNLISLSWGMANIRPGDEIVLTEMEHHANLLPWQRVARANKATLKFIPVDSQGQLQLEKLSTIITDKTKLVALAHVSNVLGTVNDLAVVIKRAHEVGAVVVVDAAQSVPHMAVDVQQLDADFVVFSGHKMLGPTGIGVLYGKADLLQRMEPFLVGGEMIREVSYESATWHDLPWKFEAGTPNIAGAIGLAAAIDYLNTIGMDEIYTHAQQLAQQAMQRLQTIGGVELYGPNDPSIRSGVVSFNLPGIHAHDVASILDESGVAVRAGHHCAQPLIKKMGLSAAVRASFYIYNDEADVDALAHGLIKARQVFRA